jgi:meso-butanediol dehydrogenase/(S,S)-butanediol dehydrogenase/diacetyl reductase
MAENTFTGKVVIVTGGGSGIGAATARRFAAQGATVVIIGRTQAKLDQVVCEAPTGSTVIARVGDVSDEEGITGLVDAVAHDHGRLDTLVNNAATVEPLGTVSDIDTKGWRRVMSTDVDGVFFASRAALPHLRAVGGSIVNVGSASGLGGDWGLAAYDAAKGAVTNLTNAMALDHGAEGVRVNAVHPGIPAARRARRRRAEPSTDAALRRACRGGFRHHVPGQFGGELRERGSYPRRRGSRCLERQSAHRHRITPRRRQSSGSECIPPS